MSVINLRRDKDGKYSTGVVMSRCMYCGEHFEVLGVDEINKIEYNGEVFSSEPCEKCKEYMESGIMICEIEDYQAANKNPSRTGRIVIIKEEEFLKNFDMPETEMSKRFFYMEESIFESAFGDLLKKEQKIDTVNEQEKPE